MAGDESPPNLNGIVTSTHDQPDRNLCDLAWQEYENITPRVIASLCEKDPKFAEALVERIEPASEDGVPDQLLQVLGHVATHLDSSAVAHSLERRFGERWQEEFEKAEAYWSRYDDR